MVFVERYVTSTAGGGGDGSSGSPWTLLEAAAAAVAGDRVNIQAGVYTLTASFSPSNDGTQSDPIVWCGYTTVPGDAVSPVSTLDINGASLHVIDCLRSYHRFENLTVTGNAGVGGSIFGMSLAGGVNLAFRCRVTATNRGVSIVGQGSQIIGCEIDQWNLGAGIQLGGDNTAAIGCYVHNGSGFGCGFSAPSSGGYYYCVSANNTGHGFVAGQSGDEFNRWMVHCTSYGNGGYGVSINGTPGGQPFVIANCIIVGNTLYGIGGFNVATGTPHVTLLGCGFWGNGSGDVQTGVALFEPFPRVALTQDPIVDSVAGDYRIRSDAGQAVGAGFPGGMLVNGTVSSWRGAPDLGAIQQTVRPLINPSFMGAF